ncbi:hypothetical protein ACLOJK_024697 [Asimina triloba]
MGNACVASATTSKSSTTVKLIFWEGTTKTLTGRGRLAGEVMFQFPNTIVCPADAFYIGHPIPALSIDHELVQGHTYFVLPLNRFACQILSAASLAALAPKLKPIPFGELPFEYVKGADGRVLIKVSPELIMRIISSSSKLEEDECNIHGGSPCSPQLCTTPELQKHYAQLVGSKAQVWSPKLETITERKTWSSSPARLLRFI